MLDSLSNILIEIAYFLDDVGKTYQRMGFENMAVILGISYVLGYVFFRYGVAGKLIAGTFLAYFINIMYQSEHYDAVFLIVLSVLLERRHVIRRYMSDGIEEFFYQTKQFFRSLSKIVVKLVGAVYRAFRFLWGMFQSFQVSRREQPAYGSGGGEYGASGFSQRQDSHDQHKRHTSSDHEQAQRAREEGYRREAEEARRQAEEAREEARRARERAEQTGRERQNTASSPPPDTRTPWEILGVVQGASKEDIKKAYQYQRSRYHPDKHHNKPAHIKQMMEEEMKKINHAYHLIG